MKHDDLIVVSASGLFCPIGGFHIDPWRPVANAVITHAHSDHLRAGNGVYHLAAEGAQVARQRLPAGSVIETLAYGEPLDLGKVRITLHPAGHILGSAQVKIDDGTRTWVVSGDYKRDADPTCAPFEVVGCDVFISEATFALPAYRWTPTERVVRDIVDWWRSNRDRGIASILFAYALGKAQRILAELTRFTDEPVYVHGAVEEVVAAYRPRGVEMLPTLAASAAKSADYRGALVIAPPGAAGSPWLHRFGEQRTGFCSGWMRVRGDRRRRGFDRGFVVSDHADWPSLLQTFRDTGAERVLLTHGHTESMCRYLEEQGVDAAPLRTEYGAEE